MVDQKRIQSLLEKHFGYHGTVTIDDEGLITVEGDVTLKKRHVIPPEIKFLRVGGSFDCSNSPISSLLGCPQIVDHSFYCANTPITSLEHAPKNVGISFVCVNTSLTSLDGLPQFIPGLLGLTYRPQLPLLRALVAQKGVQFMNKRKIQTGDAAKVAKILNRYRGQGQSGAIACAAELASAGFKANARW